MDVRVDYKESWAPKNWCFWTVVLEKSLESPFDWKEIKQVNHKGNQSWILIGRTGAEAEAPVTLATWLEGLTHWKRSWCWERWKAGGEGDAREWDGWMTSPTQWTWVWASSRRTPPSLVKDRGAWIAEVHGVTNSQTGLSDWTTIRN